MAETELRYKDTADFMITTRHYLHDGIGKLQIVTRRSSSRGTNSVFLAFEEEGVSTETVPDLAPFDPVDAKVQILKDKLAASYNRGVTLQAYRRYRTEAVEAMEAALFVATKFCHSNIQALTAAKMGGGAGIGAYAKSMDMLARAEESIMSVRSIDEFADDDAEGRQERLNRANLLENDKLVDFANFAQMGGLTKTSFGADMTKRALALLDQGWDSRYAQVYEASPRSFAENFAENEVYPDAFEMLKAEMVSAANRVFEQNDAYFELVTKAVPRVASRTCGFGQYGIMRKLVSAVDEHAAELAAEPRG